MSRSERPDAGFDSAGADADEFDYDRFGDVAADLALALPPVEPSAELKARLMARIAETPQLPAEPAPGGPGADDAAPVVAPVAPLSVGPVPVAVVPSASGQDARTDSPAESRARARWFARPAVTLTAAAAAIALFFGGVATANLLAPQDDAAQQLAAIVAAPDVQTVAAPVAHGGSATLVSSASLGVSAMVFEGLPELSDDEAYALWYINDGTPIPAGLFSVDGDGDGGRDGRLVQVLEGAFHSGTIVGVTIEPRTGSATPTTEPIVAIATEA